MSILVYLETPQSCSRSQNTMRPPACPAVAAQHWMWFMQSGLPVQLVTTIVQRVRGGIPLLPFGSLLTLHAGY